MLAVAARESGLRISKRVGEQPRTEFHFDIARRSDVSRSVGRSVTDAQFGGRMGKAAKTGFVGKKQTAIHITYLDIRPSVRPSVHPSVPASH